MVSKFAVWARKADSNAWDVLMPSSFPNFEKLHAGELLARSFSTNTIS